jgi:7-carboxy-7-deazaguanine synthase
MAKALLINEIFGPTIQGEGPATGRICAFCRLAICPLHCRWCDTWYTWSFTAPLAMKHQMKQVVDREAEVHEMSVEDVTLQVILATAGSRLVIISGGEPLAQVPPRLQHKDTSGDEEDDPLGLLIKNLYVRGIEAHIETAGIRRPSDFLHTYVDRYVVSPKLATSGNTMKARRVPEALEFFANTHKADFKFVITKPEDFSEVQYLANVYKIPPERIWVMPEGTTTDAIQRKFLMVAEGAIKRGYNVSGRMHVDIWKDVRGH